MEVKKGKVVGKEKTSEYASKNIQNKLVSKLEQVQKKFTGAINGQGENGR